MNTYAYDHLGRVTRITQSGVSGGNAVAEKRVDFSYDDFGRPATLTRYADMAETDLVAETDFTYDDLNRLTEIVHAQGSTVFGCLGAN